MVHGPARRPHRPHRSGFELLHRTIEGRPRIRRPPRRPQIPDAMADSLNEMETSAAKFAAMNSISASASAPGQNQGSTSTASLKPWTSKSPPIRTCWPSACSRKNSPPPATTPTKSPRSTPPLRARVGKGVDRDVPSAKNSLLQQFQPRPAPRRANRAGCSSRWACAAVFSCRKTTQDYLAAKARIEWRVPKQRTPWTKPGSSSRKPAASDAARAALANAPIHPAPSAPSTRRISPLTSSSLACSTSSTPIASWSRAPRTRLGPAARSPGYETTGRSTANRKTITDEEHDTGQLKHEQLTTLTGEKINEAIFPGPARQRRRRPQPGRAGD